jgi:hypothetical protein
MGIQAGGGVAVETANWGAAPGGDCRIDDLKGQTGRSPSGELTFAQRRYF